MNRQLLVRRIAPIGAALALGGGAGAAIYAATSGSSDQPTVIASVPAQSAAQTVASSTDSLTALYKKAAPGVVDITVTTSGSSNTGPGGGASQAEGTGFVVDTNGDIVTNAHVVDGASSIKVTFSDGTTRTATLSGKDNATDVAVLKIDPSGLTLHPLKLGSSASLGVGDAVAVIGSPFGYEESVSTGIVSGVDRTIQAPNGYTVAHAIQTDAALNPGNSGGPILDASGRVVGIADQIATNGNADQSSGVGFAVPIDLAKSELTRLEAGATVRHAYLGVATGGADTTGVGVQNVTNGGPADQAGLRPGDVITALEGTAVKGSNDLVAAIASHQPGDRVKLTVRRGSNLLTIGVTLGTQPTAAAAG
jgi:putative serine protease PepD